MDWFWDLNAARQSGINGPNALSLSDIASWAMLTATPISPDEVAILRAMDGVYLSAMAHEHQEAMERAKNRQD